jgi:hypothetical protein
MSAIKKLPAHVDNATKQKARRTSVIKALRSHRAQRNIADNSDSDCALKHVPKKLIDFFDIETSDISDVS